MTPRQAEFASLVGAGYNPVLAARKAGYADAHKGATRLLQHPEVAADIVRLQQKRLYEDILPLAVSVHEQMLRDKRTPAGARAQLIKLAYERTLGSTDAGAAKEPHEMTPQEIEEALAALRREVAERSRPQLELRAEPALDILG